MMKQITIAIALCTIIAGCSTREDKLKSLLETTKGKQLEREVAAICDSCTLNSLSFSSTQTTAVYSSDLMKASVGQVIGSYPLPAKGRMIFRVDSIVDSYDFQIGQITLGKIDTLQANSIYSEIQAKLTTGISFAECASEYSKDPLASIGGYIGPKSELELLPAISDLARKHKYGETFMLYDLLYGWVIFYHFKEPMKCKHVLTTTITTP